MQTTLIFETVGLKDLLQPYLVSLCSDHRFFTHDIEEVYDWFVTRAVRGVLSIVAGGNVRGFPFSDVLETMYCERGIELEVYIQELFAKNGISFHKGEVIKVMVTYRDLIVVRNI